MELIIEEISRGQKLLHRHKYQQSHISVGRGYQNDVIISDPHVCAKHLSIEFNGEDWILKDNNSLNGSFISNNKTSSTEHKINSGDIVTLGKSQIRFVFPNHPVAESVVYSSFESLINFIRQPAILMLSVLLFSAISAWIFHLNQVKISNFSHLLVPTIGALIVFALWPLGVALVSFLTKHDARTLSQLGVSFLFFNLLYINDFIEKLIAFNFSSNALISDLALIIPLIITFGLFWLNCHIGFHMSDKRRLVLASSLTVLCFGGTYLFQLSKQPDFNPNPHYNATLMTPSFNFTQGVSVSQFSKDTHILFTKAAKEAQKKP